MKKHIFSYFNSIFHNKYNLIIKYASHCLFLCALLSITLNINAQCAPDLTVSNGNVGTWTNTSSGDATVRITAIGGGGGKNTTVTLPGDGQVNTLFGGSGATMIGTFIVPAGATLFAISGQAGATSINGGAGGGGSGVVMCGNPSNCAGGTILILAGGGGGTSGFANGEGGKIASGSGNGGTNNGRNGSGGGGLNGAGQTGNNTLPPTGNNYAATGGGIVSKTAISAGGLAGYNNGVYMGAAGGNGMGGGGATDGGAYGGGGGGYSGGNGENDTQTAAGGGSFNSGTSQTNTNGVTGGGANVGSVMIECLSAAPSCITPVAYTVTGGGAYCAGGAGVTVGLANSETGVNYQLQIGGSNTGSPIGGSTGNAISFGNQTAAGNYTVIATRVSGGCTNNMTGSVSVTINPLPPINTNPTLVASTYTPCANTLVQLTATPPAGYVGIEYLWFKNGIAVNYQNGGAPTYMANPGATAGNNLYSVQMIYTGYSCFSAFSANITLTTSVPAATITPTGPLSYCANMPTTLNTTSGMSNYVWRRSSTVVGTNSNSYTPTVSGNHNVTVTDANGCSKTSTWTNLTIKPQPIANAGIDKNVCEGTSVSIGSTNNIANTYTWSPTIGLSNPSISNPSAAPTGTTTYTLTVNNASTGCSNTDAVIVNSLTLPPTPSITSAVVGNTTQLTANTPNAISVNWYRDGAGLYVNQAVNGTISVYASNPPKAYTVKSKGVNGCLSLASMPINVRIGSDKGGDTPISFENEGMSVYPNPTQKTLNISLNYTEVNFAKLLFFNNLGQVVIEKEVQLFEGKASLEVDMSQLASGVYTLSFQSEKGNVVQKVIKE